MIEQTGSIFLECPECSCFISSIYSDIYIRDENFNIIETNSIYEEDYIKSLKSANDHVLNALSPIIISKLVLKIIKSKNPKIHYKVGTFIQKFSIILKRILPDRFFEKILLHYNKL